MAVSGKDLLGKSALVGALAGFVTATVVSLIAFFYVMPVVGPVAAGGGEGSEVQRIVAREGVIQEDLVVDVVNDATPAVVSIIITKDVPVLEEFYTESPFDDLFGGPQFRFPQLRDSGETERREVGGGSGFIVSADGYVVTNKHVAYDEDADYTVFTSDGGEYTAEVLARDPLHDIAVLRIDAQGLPFVEFGDSEALRVGQTVIAIGNPLLEFENSVSVGVVSGLSRSIVAGGAVLGGTEQLDGVIQTDAAINPGNSGGPLLDLKGNVIGVNVAVASAENIGFSLPANLVKNIVDSVREHGRIIRPFLGVRYVLITERLQEANNLPVDYGALVLRGENAEELAVVPGSPADKAGLVENDIILEVDGERLEDRNALARIIAEKQVGDEVSLKILHDGSEQEVMVVLEELPE